MPNMQTAEMKNRSTMNNIIVINSIVEKQRQSHKNIYLLMQKNALTNHG